MNRFSFYTREDVDHFIEAFYDNSQFDINIVTLEADPATHRLLWHVTVRAKKEAKLVPLPPAGESVL